MEFINETGVAAGWTLGFDRDGRELIVVAIKATFDIPPAGEKPWLSETQVPLIEADEFTGEPGLSAPLREVDFAHRKPRCDVLIDATAYAPGGTPQPRVLVSARVGTMAKTFVVTGPRHWRQGLLLTSASDPLPFVTGQISYDRAYGGTDIGDGSQTPKYYASNPVGRGYRPHRHQLDGTEMPSTEEQQTPVSDPDGAYRPMSFGPIGRAWSPRIAFAGTYDDDWRDRRAPFWPLDFDDRYFQAAPPDQQIPHPIGGEVVALQNLTPDGFVSFALPTLSMPVRFVPHNGRAQVEKAVVDTIVIQPDLGRFTMTCRASRAMSRNCFQMRQLIAGEPRDAWYRERRWGHKPYYKNLAELIRSRRS
jgi:hypothetical protein